MINCKVTGICPQCGQPAQLIRQIGSNNYFWDHDNSRDLFVHGGNAFRRHEHVPVEEEEAKRLIRLSDNGKRNLIDHSEEVVCVQTGEVYRNKYDASRATGIRAGTICHALNRGCNAGGNFWRYREYYWRPDEKPDADSAAVFYSGWDAMEEMDAVSNPLDLARKGCPNCGSHFVEIDGRTMLPALMDRKGLFMTRELESLTGIVKWRITQLKRWENHHSGKQMEAAKIIAKEFGVTVEFLLSLDPWRARLRCHECNYDLSWMVWEIQVEKEGRANGKL